MSMERVREIENKVNGNGKVFNFIDNYDVQFLIDTVKQQNEQIEDFDNVVKQQNQILKDLIGEESLHQDEKLQPILEQKEQRIEELTEALHEIDGMRNMPYEVHEIYKKALNK